MVGANFYAFCNYATGVQYFRNPDYSSIMMVDTKCDKCDKRGKHDKHDKCDLLGPTTGDLKMAHRAERGTYDPVELGLSMAKNGVSSVKRKKTNFCQKNGPWQLA